MTKGTLLFLLVFVAISSKARAFLAGVLGQATDSLNEWAPYSYWVLGVLGAAFLASVIMVKTWPSRSEPESPMAKYKHQVHIED